MKLASLGLTIVALMLLGALAADLVCSWTGLSPTTQNLEARLLPPGSRSELSSSSKESLIEKWIALYPAESQQLSLLLKEAGVSHKEGNESLYDLGLRPATQVRQILQKLDRDFSGGKQQLAVRRFQVLVAEFSILHILGTDEIGRDTFIRLLYGARVSLGVGLFVALISAVLGLLVGGLAGFYGGFLDALLMRGTDAFLALPLLPLLILMSAVDLQKFPATQALIPASQESLFKMLFILSLFSWMPVARLIRGSTLSLREREFVLAAKSLGASDWMILTQHILPHVITPGLLVLTLGIGETILFEASLSFLGLGIMPPVASWGNMLTNSQEIIYRSPWPTFLPGIMIFLAIISFNFIGDGLQMRSKERP